MVFWVIWTVLEGVLRRREGEMPVGITQNRFCAAGICAVTVASFMP